MMAEVNAAQKFFMEKQGVSKLEDVKIEAGEFIVPLGKKKMKVVVDEEGYMSGFDIVKEE